MNYTNIFYVHATWFSVTFSNATFSSFVVPGDWRALSPVARLLRVLNVFTFPPYFDLSSKLPKVSLDFQVRYFELWELSSVAALCV